jgi:peptidoglycan hydrolase-like protein with peptidoglycan-binding domain
MIETPTTVLNWTGHYSELKLGDECDDIQELRILLNKAGINMEKYNTGENVNYYDTGLEEAVSEFQKISMGIEPTMKVDDATLNALIIVANNMSDIIYSETTSQITIDTSDENLPHFDSFFAADNKKVGRKNQVDIKIILGDNNIIKTIHNVYMRSVSTEFDTSGNPISEVYEFIAQDFFESDEPNDINKY